MLLIVSGTRPEVIKLFPVYKQLKDANLKVAWAAAGQHQALLAQALDFFSIKADYILPAISSANLSEQVAKLIEQLSILFTTCASTPELVIVQGDTATALAAALAAFFLKIKIAYVEAGLRSFDLHAPFPEEGNRQIIARVADLLFAPTNYDQNNLLAEGIPAAKVFVTGNTVVDALLYTTEQIKQGVKTIDPFIKELVERARQANREIIVFTMHRREALDGLGENVLCQMTNLLGNLANYAPAVRNPLFIYLQHPNPKFSFVADFYRQPCMRDFAVILPPQNYQDTIYLLQQAFLVMTDSGGMLEEAVSLHKTVVCLREKTERFFPGLENDVFLIGNNAEGLITAFILAAEQAFVRRYTTTHQSVFGDGQAAEKIVSIISRALSLSLPPSTNLSSRSSL